MSCSDPIADSLTKIRNASRAKHPTVEVRSSTFLARILDVLKREGFIRLYKPVGETAARRSLRVYLKYVNRTPVITELTRVSKPGVRRYCRATELPRVRRGLGVAVLSTSQGVMTEQEAYRQRLGGEVVCYVW